MSSHFFSKTLAFNYGIIIGTKIEFKLKFSNRIGIKNKPGSQDQNWDLAEAWSAVMQFGGGSETQKIHSFYKVIASTSTK